MISIKQIKEKDIELCFELDSNSISLWSKKQWANEFKKEGINALGILLPNLLIGICVFQVVLDEAQINYFAVNYKFRKKGFGTTYEYFNKTMWKFKYQKTLEVSQNNATAEKFYSSFDFSTVGIRRNYYKDGSDALKEKFYNKII